MSEFTTHLGGKEKEFMDAYTLYADSIYRHCYFRVYNKELAQDITQETFIKTWKCLAKGQEIKNIRAFLYRVAVNAIIDHSRKRTTLVLDNIKEKQASIRLYNTGEADMLDSLEIKEIMEILKTLDKKYQQVIVMRYIDGFSPGEIADVLNISTNAASVKLNYALKKLRAVINLQHYAS